ncbi:TPA: DUF3011 domain-containing protein, partial [Stenotrophomonas maltophilia]
MKPLSLASLALTLSVGGLAGLALPVAPAAAQNGVVRCESQNNRERVCNTGWRSAQMVRQLSGSSCVEGRTWGSRNGSIWVTNGCRAEFVEGRGGWGGGNGGNWGGGSGGTIRCESQDNRERTCPTNWRGATLVRQISGSACVEGQTWGVRRGSIWVNRGCRGEFAESRGGWGGGNGGNWGGGNSNYSVTCSSNNNRTQNCDWDERQGRPVLQQQLSGSACQEGRSWGYSRGQVWVSNGCRARFGTR